MENFYLKKMLLLWQMRLMLILNPLLVPEDGVIMWQESMLLVGVKTTFHGHGMKKKMHFSLNLMRMQKKKLLHFESWTKGRKKTLTGQFVVLVSSKQSNHKCGQVLLQWHQMNLSQIIIVALEYPGQLHNNTFQDFREICRLNSTLENYARQMILQKSLQSQRLRMKMMMSDEK